MVLYYILLPLAWLVFHIGFRVHTVGRENLRKVQTKGCIIAPNHVSAIDPVFIVISRFWGRRMLVFAKKELFEINALLQQDEKEAHHVATALEIYVKGSLNLFNHRTNVNVNNRIVCYDIKELGKQMKKLGMLIVQDQVWGRVTANRSSGKSTRYYMDEMHLLLKEEQTAAYSVEIWKRFRKWGGIPTGLTQNVKDLLSSREVENIFENSDMIIMLNQAAGDRQILAKQLNISPHQLSYVTHSGEGEGLLFFGNVILPFVDRFPTDLELYRIMTTKLGEISEGAQK